MDDVRRYSHELRSGVLDYLGLRAALEQLADDGNKLQQIAAEVTVEGEERGLPDDVKLGLFRIVQEALSNARKHSGGSQVNISLFFNDNLVRVQVSDNGSGFDIEETRVRAGNRGSLGLMSMQERAKLIGADLRIESQPGKGTSVIAEVKL